MPKNNKQITDWLYAGEDGKLFKTKHGHITDRKWLLMEKLRFRNSNIETEIRVNPDNENKKALFYLNKSDVSVRPTQGELRKY